MYKLMEQQLGVEKASHGCLESWADEGVLLLNVALTVRKGEPMSHAKLGWEKFTDAVIKIISTQHSPCVYFLLGKFAQKKAKLIDTSRHKIVCAPHPSPLSFKLWMASSAFSDLRSASRELGHDINLQLPKP